MAQRAGQSSAQNWSSLASRKCAQLLSEALTAGRPRRSQLLSTRTFHAGSDANEETLMCDGTKDGMLGLLQSELEPWRWLDVRGASEVLDAISLEVHDLLVQSEGLFTSKHVRLIVCRCCCGGSIRARCEREEDLRACSSLSDAVALV